MDSDEEGAAEIRVAGRTTRMVDLVDRWDFGVSRAWDAVFRRARFHARAWRDDDANRINVVRASGREGVDRLVECVADSMDAAPRAQEGGEPA